MQPAPRRRTRWPWAVGAVAAVCAVIVVAVVLSLGSSHHGASAGSSVSAGPSSVAPTPTVGNLQLSQLRVGDCLTGANMELNTSDPWPKLTLAVPCNQPHTAEIFLANDTLWPRHHPFP